MAAAPERPERIGRYRLLEKLGQGGMATVYRAVDEELKREVALKLMHPFLAGSAEAHARFSREARAVAKLRHPNVLQVFDYAPEEGERPAYLVAELIAGPTLRQFLDRHGAPLAEVAAACGAKIAEALAAAHRVGIVHRDVKPENVMVDAGGRIVLCDFGIAHVAYADVTVTKTGAVIGSPAYMSPEQAAGSELDERSDLFSLGTVLYQLATGVLPFQAKEPLVLLSKIHRGEHLPPGAKNARVPPYLERVIERCLQVDPAARFQKADEVAEALAAGLRKDGMGEVDRELADYFRDPPAYNSAAEPRIVKAALEQATAAAKAGEKARALQACGRVLSWRPGEPEASALVRRIGARSRLGRIAVAAAAALLVGGGGFVLYRTMRSGAPATFAPAKADVPGPVAAREVDNKNDSRSEAAPPLAPVPVKEAPRIERRRPAKAVPLAAAPPVAVPREVAPPPVEQPSPPPEVTPALGKLTLDAQPYCVNGRVDLVTPIDKGRTVELPPGSHRVRCQGPFGKVIEREVQIAAGKTEVLRIDFRGGPVAVPLALTRGDAVQVGEGKAVPRGGRLLLAPKQYEVKLYRAGAVIDHAFLDVPPGGCVLRDDPLECVKP